MEPLILKMTEDTPAVIFFPKYNKFQIVGTSWPELPQKFYDPLIRWLEQYFDEKPTKETVFEFFFKYFNTGSFKKIIEIISFLKEKTKNFNVKIIWYYEEDDPDMKKFGQQLEKYLNFKMNFKSRKQIKG